jgi:hypothetical protein
MVVRLTYDIVLLHLHCMTCSQLARLRGTLGAGMIPPRAAALLSALLSNPVLAMRAALNRN